MRSLSAGAVRAYLYGSDANLNRKSAENAEGDCPLADLNTSPVRTTVMSKWHRRITFKDS